MSALLGCIADDFTGGTDLAGMLVKSGMRTVQIIGVPTGGLPGDIDAAVVALKSRTAPVEEAIVESLAALRALQAAGCRQFYFKYCSTFDSTPRGNIGPVAEALMEALGADFTIACPAFPANQRTIYKGYLFVGDVPLNESGMRNHPLTPMTDANLVRVLQAQARRKVGLIDYTVVAQGEEAIRARIAKLREEGVGIAVVDAISDADLQRLGPALRDMPLVTAGSGVAIGLTANFGIALSSHASALPPAKGARAIVSGSCSVATRDQVEAFRAAGGAVRAVDFERLSDPAGQVRAIVEWAKPYLAKGPVLVYSTAEPDKVKSVQSRLGEGAGERIESILAAVARALVESAGVRQLVVAGGETSGAVVQALGVETL